MKQYLLSVHSVEGEPVPAPEVMRQMFADVAAFNAKLQAQGMWVFGGGLHPPSTATVVRVEHGQVLTTDGPFAEGKEHIGGFWVIAAPDLDAALAWAAEGAVACAHPVEVRPFQEDVAEDVALRAGEGSGEEAGEEAGEVVDGAGGGVVGAVGAVGEGAGD